MNDDTAQLLLYGLVIVLTVPVLGSYMARVYRGERVFLTPALAPVEKIIYRALGVSPDIEQHWLRYALSAIMVNCLAALGLYAIFRLQYYLPFNPRQYSGMEPGVAFNSAISFITSTNWQIYSGEAELSYFSQMFGCTSLNFISTATAMAVAAAVIRGFVTSQAKTLGNFHVDFVRSTLYILLPISIVCALFFVTQGVPQTLSDYTTVKTIEGADQTIAVGPAASQIAIKMLGSNGGGFFNANAAHPFSNPTPLSNFVQLLLILLIPAAFTFTLGRMAGDVRQSWVLFSALAIIFGIGLLVVYWAEGMGNPLLAQLPIDQTAGNMEGKETRFGTAASAIWAVATTATATGAVNSMLDSFTPLGGMIVLMNLQLSEVVFGGAGSGLYSVLFYVVLSVFIASLMVGRTPEYLGKRIETKEIKLTVLTLLIVPIGMLLVPAIAIMIPSAVSAIHSQGPHGLTEVLFAYASATAANGASFASFDGKVTFHMVAQALCMIMGRYAFITVGLAIAGSLGAKRTAVVSTGSVPTNTPLFVVMLVAVIFIFGMLGFFPAIALGPLAEHFEMISGTSF